MSVVGARSQLDCQHAILLAAIRGLELDLH